MKFTTRFPALALALSAVASLTLGAGCDEPRKLGDGASAGASSTADAPKGAPGDERFTFEGTVVRAKAGEAARVGIEVKPAGKLKINPEFPWKLTAEASEQVDIQSPEVKKDSMTLGEATATIPLELVPKTPGKHEVAAKVSLSVCEKDGKKRCFFARDEPVVVTLNVE